MRKLVLSLLIMFSALWSNGQDTQFSQYFAASLYLNPAFAGVYNNPTLTFNYRQQPPTDQGILELTAVSFVFPVKPQGKLEKAIGGIGLMAFQEKSGYQGSFQNSGAFLTYAHNLKFGLLTSDAISIGIQAGFESRTSEYSNFNWGSQYNPFYGYDDSLFGPVNEFDARISNFLLNAGIMYYYNPERNYLLYSYSAFSGISVTNVNRPNRSFGKDVTFKEAMLWKYNGGVELKFNKLFATPSLMFQYASGNYQFNSGLQLAYSPMADRYRSVGPSLLLGTWYRFRDSFIFMGGVKIKGLVIRGSYDMNTQFLSPERNVTLTNNSFELSLQYSLGRQESLRKISNPLF